MPGILVIDGYVFDRPCYVEVEEGGGLVVDGTRLLPLQQAFVDRRLRDAEAAARAKEADTDAMARAWAYYEASRVTCEALEDDGTTASDAIAAWERVPGIERVVPVTFDHFLAQHPDLDAASRDLFRQSFATKPLGFSSLKLYDEPGQGVCVAPPPGDMEPGPCMPTTYAIRSWSCDKLEPPIGVPRSTRSLAVGTHEASLTEILTALDRGGVVEVGVTGGASYNPRPSSADAIRDALAGLAGGLLTAEEAVRAMQAAGGLGAVAIVDRAVRKAADGSGRLLPSPPSTPR